jgi:hypothetical protein
MPTASAIVLTDGAAVDHTFTPEGRDANGVTNFKKTTGVPLGDEKLSINQSKTAQGRRKVSIRMQLPILADAAGEDGVTRPTIVRTAFADVTLSFDATSSITERKNLRYMIADLFGAGQTLSEAVIDNLEALY